jgi:hypothetical protein
MEIYVGDFDGGGVKEEHFDLKKLFIKEISKKEIMAKYKNITYMIIYDLSDLAYIYNLRKLPNLECLSIGNISNILFYEELCNLKKLIDIDMCNNFPETMNSNIYINGLSKCENLRHLLLKTNLKYFPVELTRLRNLETLYYSSYDDKIKIKKISQKIFNMKNLESFTLRTNIKYIINKNKMLIFDFTDNVKIPKKIKHLKIFHYEDQYINNLPKNIETLILAQVNKLPINNLPINLKKITILYKEVCNYNNLTNEICIKNITEHDLKIPYGCEILIIS